MINPKNKNIWALMSLSFALLLLSALVFQYIFKMEPCIKCIYQRVGVISLCIIFTIPLIFRGAVARTITYISSLLVICKCLTIAREHSLKQHNLDPSGSCGFRPDFPDWLPLDQWLPSIFEVRGACDQINWLFQGYTMPEWLSVIYISTLILLMVLIRNEKNL